MNQPILLAKDLKKSFGNDHAVKGISFEIARSEIFGLLGPNGAGKTTTISMLSGLLKADGGLALINGQEMGPDANGVKSKIGLVPQELALYPTLSAQDNLMFFGRIYGLKGKHLRQRVAEVLEIVGLTERARDRIDNYSGGMKRRVNIAAGLLHKPEILFLDEPTVGVDPQSRNAIFESIEVLNKEGLTIIYTTHYMEEAERLCNRIAIIDKGEIIALDTLSGLVRQLGGGLVRVGLYNGKADLVYNEVAQMPDALEVNRMDNEIIVKARETRNVLINILDITHKLDAQVTALEILEPNLENVFLHLTGKSLRD